MGLYHSGHPYNEFPPSSGTLIRRHRIPLPSPHDSQYYTVENFNVGQQVILHGKLFQITVSFLPILTE